MDELIEVRTTMRPWEPLHVDRSEYEHLRNEGLILPGTEQQDIAQAVAQAAQPEATPRGAAKKKEN